MPFDQRCMSVYTYSKFLLQITYRNVWSTEAKLCYLVVYKEVPEILVGTFSKKYNYGDTINIIPPQH